MSIVTGERRHRMKKEDNRGWKLLASLRRNNWQNVRLALQSAGSAVVAYGAARALGLPEASWAVFSALFVVQSNIGGTVHNATQRLLGGAIGLALGLAAVSLFGRDPWATVLALVAGTGCMTLITSMRGGMSYGLVTVTMLILAPGSEPYEGALLKAVEIGVGCLSGVGVTALLFPRRAHREADHHLAEVARSCAEILGESLKSIEAQELKDLQNAHDHVEQQLQLARASSLQSQPHLRSPSNVHHLRDELRRKLERLWYTLALVDRLRDAFASSPPPPELKQASEAARQSMTERLHRLADLLDGRPVKEEDLAKRDRLEPEVSGKRNDPGSILFSFACSEIEATIDDVVETAQDLPRLVAGR